MKVDATLGGFGLEGDFVDEGGVVTLVGEDFDGGIEDALVADLGAELLDRHTRSSKTDRLVSRFLA
jgi:hypothetical protein